MRRVRVTVVAVEKQYYIFSVCVCSLSYVKRMRRIILPSVACLAIPYLSTLSHKRNDFGEKVTGYEMRVLIFSTTLSRTFFILRRIQGDISIIVHRCSCKNSSHSCHILIKRGCSLNNFLKYFLYQSS